MDIKEAQRYLGEVDVRALSEDILALEPQLLHDYSKKIDRDSVARVRFCCQVHLIEYKL